ncbi:PepSY-associated TM helix domain-containing protein [Enterovirga sp. CN4-39]|uniref:PepSY-associated TM helix domain-containing protein n=1 Tax=Enterovirga sp. CN4-39 TaxID=3400910 RepID=UPI003C04E34C
MTTASKKKRRSYWLKQLHLWHWVSSAICLVGLLLFTVTGITLNHAAEIEGKPKVFTREAQLAPALAGALAPAPQKGRAPLPAEVAAWLGAELGLDLRSREAEWSAGEAYVSLPRAGGDAWLTVARDTGEVVYERTDRGWISYLNDLHKGRNTGTVWKWFIDFFAVACLVFTLTGLVLLQLHSHNRPSTWPLVGFGLLGPVLLLLFFIH